MITTENNYWIHSSALNFTLNALDTANLIQCNVVNSAVIQCFINHVDEEDTLGFSASHSYKSWKLAAGPTCFNTKTAKYVYAAIPKDPGNNTAIIVYPSEKLDIYGRNEGGEQIGSSNHYYIWLQGVISAEKTQDGRTYREWNPYISTGKLDTPEGDLEQSQSSEWYSYAPHTAIVSLLKQIQMTATSWFSNIRLGSNKHNLTGVATGETADEYMDSDELVATPSYIKANYVSKKNDDTVEGNITFGKDIKVGGNAIINGILQVGSWIKAQWAELAYIKSPDYTGDSLHDTGFLLTNNGTNGRSKLTVDELYVRVKAIFEELQVKKETVTGGNQVYSCAANVISFTRFINSQGEDVSFHYVKVPVKMKGVPTFISKLLAVTNILTTSKLTRRTFSSEEFEQEVSRVRCYFLAKEGEQTIENWWHGDNNGHDLARCQTFNLLTKYRETYVDGGISGIGNIFWWRKVIGVSTTPEIIDNKEYHWFDVAVSDCAEGSDYPAAGDHVSQFGNDLDPDRMNLIMLEIDSDEAPSIKMFEGIDSYSLDMGRYGDPLKTRLSPKAGYKMNGSKFELVTEYASEPIPIERGDWVEGTYYYYYNIVQHNGASWLCIASSGNPYIVKEEFTHEGTVYPKGKELSQEEYNALTPEEKAKCYRSERGATLLEPSEENSAVWKIYAKKGETGDDGNGIKKITRTYGISAESTTANETTAPSDISSWAASSPAVTEEKPYLWAKEVVEYTKSAATTKYYMIGARGDNGVDAKDVEWVYVRTTENVAPTIVDESGDGYKADDFKPLAKVASGRIKGMTEGNANVSVRCTDDPQGVNDTWKYEWEIKRTKGNATNGHREWQKYSGTMTLHNNLSESAFVIDLDNNADQFGTDSTGKVLVEQKRSTKASLYYGSQEQALTALSASLKYEDGTGVASDVASVTADKTTGIVEVTIKVNNTISHAEIVATITATCARGSKTITFPIQKVMSGAPGVNPVIYQLAPTQKAFSFGRDASNNLTPSSASSKINVAKTEGNTTTVLTSAQTGITYSWGFENETTPASGHSGLAVGTSITISNSDAANHTSVWVELSTGDRETLPITKDGAKGENGNDAQYIYLKGTARDANSQISNTVSCEVRVNGGTNLATLNRGLNLVTINRQTLARVESINYDTYGEAADSQAALNPGITNLIAKLNSLDDSVFVCLVSFDAIGWQRPADVTAGTYPLITALQGYGMSDDLPYTATGRYPFLFIGYKNLGKGNGLTRMRNTGNYYDVVELSAYIANGALTVKDGDNAVSVRLSPDNVIVTQNTTSPYNIDLTNAYTDISVVKGDSAVGNGDFSIELGTGQEAPYHCTASIDTSNNRKRVVITSIRTDSSGKYYENAYVIIKVTYRGITHTLRFGVYCNLLGTWKETVVGDTKTEVAKSLTHGYDPDSGNVIPLENFGEYIRSSEENISTIRKNISSYNLFTGLSDGDGWTKDSFIPTTCCFYAGEKVISPLTRELPAGDYVVSAYNPNEMSFVIKDENNNTIASGFAHSISEDEFSSAGRQYLAFTLNDAARIKVEMLYYDETYYSQTIYRPQLEQGSFPSAFDASNAFSESQIKQTANQIKATITNELGETGVDIENGEINLRANKVKFTNSDGSVSDKISIDPATGTLNATNAKITGGIFADRVTKVVCKTWQSGAYGSGPLEDPKTYYLYTATEGQPLYACDHIGSTMVHRDYYAVGEIALKSNHFFILASGINDSGTTFSGPKGCLHIKLPDPRYCIGMSIVITNKSTGFPAGSLLLEQEFVRANGSGPRADGQGGSSEHYICMTAKELLFDYPLYPNWPDVEVEGNPYKWDTEPDATKDGRLPDNWSFKDGEPVLGDMSSWVVREDENYEKEYSTPMGNSSINGIWLVGNNNFPTILTELDLNEYEWIELVAVEWNIISKSGINPEIVNANFAEFNTQWMVTRWEKKATV